MQEPTSAILAERVRPAGDLRRPVIFSAAAHVVFIAAALLGPSSWLAADSDEGDLNVMTLRLGGPAGPGEGGLTPLGGRPVQEVTPLSEARRPEWIQPPTPTPPEMILPVPDAETRRRPEPEVETETAPEEARGRTPTRGPEAREGTTMADTGVEGLGDGLSAGGLGGAGLELDVGNFCCPEYLATMLDLIRRQWDSNQRVPGVVVIRFTVQRSGAIDEVSVFRGSGHVALDLGAQRAVLLAATMPPLPSRFPEESLTVRLTFEYES